MSEFGSLSLTNSAIPAYAPPYRAGTTTTEFSDVDLVFITYRTTRASVRPLVPSMLSLADEPLVTVGFLAYGMSGVGAYREYAHLVEVTYGGETFDYGLSLVLDNEAAIFSGREQFGYPKKFGKVVINNTGGGGGGGDTGSTGGGGWSILTGSVERPVGQRIVQFGFVPTTGQRIPGGLVPNRETDKRTLNLRLIPSPVVGGPTQETKPSVRELVPVYMEITAPEAWLGQGSLSFPEPSEFDPLHRLEIVRYEQAVFARKAECVLRPPTEVFSL